jgi:hypothetical protein
MNEAILYTAKGLLIYGGRKKARALYHVRETYAIIFTVGQVKVSSGVQVQAVLS